MEVTFMSLWSIVRGWFCYPEVAKVEIPVPEESELRSILADLTRMAEIMTGDGEDNFIRGVRLTIAHMEEALAKPEEAQVSFSRGADTYQSMWGGSGSLTEFYLMEGSPEEVKRLQGEYDALVKRLRPQLVRDHWVT